MKARERFDKLLHACRVRIQEEVSALIGRPFVLGEPVFRQSSKEELFAEPGFKEVLAHIRLEGEIQGAGCLIVGIKDAILIGGTLIMLPNSELENVVASQDYSEELQDSYGEVANIICGATTVTFEEQYPKSVRLVRMEQEVFAPAKVVVESDQPIADVPYYVMTTPMQLDGSDLGALRLILPAEPFGLVMEAAKGQPDRVEEVRKEPEASSATVAKEVAGEAIGVLDRQTAGDGSAGSPGVLDRPAEVPATAHSEGAVVRKRDVGKQRKRVDELLKNSMARVSEEVSALLGGTLQITVLENLAVTKEMFLEQAGGRQIMTRLDLRGGSRGPACLFVDVKSAVYLGGCLIMLPEGELEETVRNEEFGDDARDAYGEVTNIIAGVYTAVFEEQSTIKLGFVKTSMEAVTPAKINPDSDEVFDSRPYYLSLGRIQYNGRDLGRMQLLIPAEDLDLEALLLPEAETSRAEEQPAPTVSAATGKKILAPVDPVARRQDSSTPPDILLYTDDDGEAERIASVLETMGYGCRILHFKEPVNHIMTPRVQLVFLVMREASEQGFGVAIKVTSAGLPVPLVAAAPAWTRTLVLKAVKYGACDILITPSSSEDIREKIEINLARKAA